ncbi:MAG TPA: hypothetical protein VFU88_01855 [Ktedonobacterales bacterium]|nr:hypothetical protein [Ktedonobacterales bacterium]
MSMYARPDAAVPQEPESAPAATPELASDGWTRRFTAIGPRLSEAVELYRALGYELRLEPADSSEMDLGGEACAQCMVMTLARTIYTRPAVEPARDEGKPSAEQQEG